MKIIDCTKYSNKSFLQMLKGNPKYQQAIALKNTWEEVIDVVDSLNLKYSKEQIEFVKLNQWY